MKSETTRHAVVAALAVLGLGLSQVPAQAQSWTVDGVGKASDMSKVHQLSDSHMVIMNHSEYTEIADADPSNPLHGATGPCFGATEVKPPQVTGAGRCVFTASGGDMISIEWTATGMSEQGAITGDWQLVGGTGAFDGASGGGQFSSLSDNDAGEETNTIGGEITLP
ncbi:hypothetical protein GE300_05280 [Rhodobacteraceae bacterium 2CG4]|uniref:Aegerolysin n=1 Tax=Halovulum marinum TaxID=2662447 RepID=A0A6L5YXV5_9RHOB|nr:hypothetical protein [Halovulum marinum]MSU89038.1 hypothetical protein [Halovulum marinum]